MVNEFIKKEIPNHYYTFAIHDKPASLGDGKIRNLHCHLMLSDRMIDDAELEKERLPKYFFQYPKRSAVTLEDKRKGGAPKDRRFNERGFLPEVRKSFAEITNDILQKYGKPDRVDHRSLEAMKREAIASGDEYLAKLLDRLPETHIGLINALDENSAAVRRLKEYRECKSAYRDALFEQDFLKQKDEETKLQQEISGLISKANRVVRLPAYALIDELAENDLNYKMREEFLAALREVKAWKSSIVWADDVIENAQYEFIDDEEDKESWQNFRTASESLHNYEVLRKSLSSEGKLAEPELAEALGAKIAALDKALNSMLPTIKEVEGKLDNPVARDRLQKYIHKALEDEKYSKRQLAQAASRLQKVMQMFADTLLEDEREIAKKESVTLKELYGILRKRYYGYRKEYVKAKKVRDELRLKVIVPSRARKMAEKIYEKNLDANNNETANIQALLSARTGKLAAEKERLKKAKEDYAIIMKQMADYKSSASREDLAAGGREDYKAKIGQFQTLIHEKSQAVSAAREALNRREEEILASMPQDVQDKINEIALGILEKNLHNKKAFDLAEKRLQKIQTKLEKAEREMDAVKERLAIERKEIRYRVKNQAEMFDDEYRNYVKDYNGGIPSLIAEALAGDPAVIHAVMRETDGTDGKKWSELSWEEKEERILKEQDRYI